MNQHQFLNRLLSLYNIDADRLPELSQAEWPKFRDDPVHFLIRLATENQRTAIWREIEARQLDEDGFAHLSPRPTIPLTRSIGRTAATASR